MLPADKINKEAKEYLTKVAVPHLVEGLTELAMRKPADPMLWLSQFILDKSASASTHSIVASGGGGAAAAGKGFSVGGTTIVSVQPSGASSAASASVHVSSGGASQVVQVTRAAGSHGVVAPELFDALESVARKVEARPAAERGRRSEVQTDASGGRVATSRSPSRPPVHAKCMKVSNRHYVVTVNAMDGKPDVTVSVYDNRSCSTIESVVNRERAAKLGVPPVFLSAPTLTYPTLEEWRVLGLHLEVDNASSPAVLLVV